MRRNIDPLPDAPPSVLDTSDTQLYGSAPDRVTIFAGGNRIPALDAFEASIKGTARSAIGKLGPTGKARRLLMLPPPKSV